MITFLSGVAASIVSNLLLSAYNKKQTIITPPTMETTQTETTLKVVGNLQRGYSMRFI